MSGDAAVGTGPGEEDPELVDRLYGDPDLTAAASAVRELGHALVRHRPPEDVLAAIRASADALRARVEPWERRGWTLDGLLHRLRHVPVEEGRPATLDHLGYGCGPSNPLGFGFAMTVQGDEVVARGSLGSAFAGAPAQAHGGAVAALVDDVLGSVMALRRQLAYTASLEIRYHAPTPVNRPIEVRARLRAVERGMAYVDGGVWSGGLRLCSAEGTFVVMQEERLRKRLARTPAEDVGE